MSGPGKLKGSLFWYSQTVVALSVGVPAVTSYSVSCSAHLDFILSLSCIHGSTDAKICYSTLNLT